MTAEAGVRGLNSERGLQGQPSNSLRALRHFCVLTKPDINLLVAFTVFAGFFLAPTGCSHSFWVLRLFHTLIGTFMVSGGSCALNHYVERRFDARMRRTARRPLASGEMSPGDAFWFGLLLSLIGLAYLALTVNLASTVLAGLASAIYLFAYTPLKRESPICTFVGAIPGAIPPLIGWAGAAGRLSLEAWGLFAIVFLWQFPHFMAIAWIYREDYARAGYHVLPAKQKGRQIMELQIALPLLTLLCVELAFKRLGYAGWPSVTAMLILTVGYFCPGVELILRRHNTAARRLLFASLLYLPSVLFVLLFNKV